MKNLFEYSDILHSPIEAFSCCSDSFSMPVKSHWHYFTEVLYLQEEAASAPAGGRRYLCRRTGDGAMRCDHAGAAAPKKSVYFSRVSLCGCYSVYDRLAVYVPGCRRTAAGDFGDCGLCTQGQEL
mgnify:CR=1 FL=1